MTSRHWPLFDLRIRTPRLELRLPTDEQYDDLIDLALDGVHAPDFMPFAQPWTDVPREDLPLNSLKHYWAMLAKFGVDDWRLEFVVLRDGEVVGTQGLGAKQFPILKEVGTGSWIGRRFHRQGIGTEMRAAVLHFAFAGLHAESAISTAYEDNLPSRGVSRKLGYRDDGILRNIRRGEPATEIRMRLSREDWRDDVPVTIDGLDGCLPYLTKADAG
jgi:RimJ/RimL family protein N-acetyltransferase